MGRALIFLIIKLLKQRWFPQLFYWFAILMVVLALLALIISFSILEPVFTVGALLVMGFWGLIVFLMRRKLKKDQ